MALGRDIKKAIETNTNWQVKKVFKPETETYGYDGNGSIIMIIEVVVKRKPK